MYVTDTLTAGNLTVTGAFTFGDAQVDLLTVNGYIYVEHTAATENTKALDIYEAITDAAKGARQGAIYINRTRYTVMTASDGNPDCGLKMQIYNRSASEAYARSRGIDLTVECRDTGAGSLYLQGAYIAVKNRSGSTMNNSGSMTAIIAETNHNATGTCEVVGLNINDITQSFTASALYGIKLTTGAYGITRTAAMYVSSAAGIWTSIIMLPDARHTYFLDFGGVGGCLTASATALNGITTSHKLALNITGVGTVYVPVVTVGMA
jgi:hypothetical protein